MKAPSKRASVVVLLVSTVALSLPALGRRRTSEGSHDPKDASTRLDLATVSLRHHSETHRYKWRFTTYERFRLRNGGSILLLIDSVGAERYDYGLRLWYDGGHGLICSGGPRPGVGGAGRFQIGVFRIEPRSGWCTFKGIRRTKALRWKVETFREQYEPLGVPLDRAPNVGWF